MYKNLVTLLRKKYDKAPMVMEAADAIEELAATAESYKRSMEAWADEAANAKPRWIPVKERLPEDEEMVLCFTPVDGFMFVGFHISYKWGSNTVSKWRIITAMRSTKDITKKVTHWMPLPEPLPEPPKEGA